MKTLKSVAVSILYFEELTFLTMVNTTINGIILVNLDINISMCSMRGWVTSETMSFDQFVLMAGISIQREMTFIQPVFEKVKETHYRTGTQFRSESAVCLQITILQTAPTINWFNDLLTLGVGQFTADALP